MLIAICSLCCQKYLNLPNKDSRLKLPSLINKAQRGFETPYYLVLKLQRRDKLSLPGLVKAFSIECVLSVSPPPFFVSKVLTVSPRY